MLAVPSPTKAAAVAANPRWVTSMALRALVTLAPRKGATFTAAALAAAAPELTTPRCRRAITKLSALGFITFRRVLAGDTSGCVYTVTADGAAAIAAVADGAVLMAGARTQPIVRPDTLRARLWRLVRMRKRLSAEEAVQLLADADDAKLLSKRSQVNAHLRAWAANGTLKQAPVMGPRRQKQYLLLADPGPAVPTLMKKGAA